jgi:uncharacterized protein YecA (UPF0149 family)
MPRVQFFDPVGVAASLLAEPGINVLRFEAASGLLADGGRLIDETGGEPLGGSRRLLAVQSTRASHTFEAVIANCQIGRGVQAAMLNRSLLEDVLDVHWVAANPEAAPQRADEHDRLIALAEHREEHRFGRTDRLLTSAELAELETLVELYGGRTRAFQSSWTRAGFPQRFDLVKERWSDDEGAAQYLDYVYDVIQRQNNVLLHGSPTGYRQAMSSDADGRPRQINRVGPDPRWRDSLSHGALGYYMVLKVLVSEFSFEADPLAEAFERTSCYLKPFAAPQLSAVPDGTECPCGSGRMVEHCHRW